MASYCKWNYWAWHFKIRQILSNSPLKKLSSLYVKPILLRVPTHLPREGDALEGMLPLPSISVVQSFWVVGDAERSEWPLRGAPAPMVSPGVMHCTGCPRGFFLPRGAGFRSPATRLGTQVPRPTWNLTIPLGPRLGSMSRSLNSGDWQTQTSVSCLDPSQPFFLNIAYLLLPRPRLLALPHVSVASCFTGRGEAFAYRLFLLSVPFQGKELQVLVSH